MPFTSSVDFVDMPLGWRSLAGRLTPEQIRHLSAMERHPAYTHRPRLLLLEALEYVQPGAVGEYVATRVARA